MIRTVERLMPPVREIFGSNSGRLLTIMTRGFPRIFPTLKRMTGLFSNTLMVTIFLIIHNHAATVYWMIRLAVETVS
jgi:hypothetical protein